MSLFDSPDFNQRLFFPRPDASEPPPGAVDRFVDVPGASLHVRTHAAPAAARTLLLFHGNGEVVADYDNEGERYAAAGFRLAVVDFRGYGRSTGTPTLRNVIADARVVVDAVATDGPIVVMGRSIGSSCANELYGAVLPSVAGVVVESGYTDVGALVQRRGLTLAGKPTGEDRVFDPVPKLARGTQPLLVLHGANDTLISAREAETAYAAAGGANKRLVLVPHRGHNDLSFSEVYWTALAAFASALR